MFLQQGDLVFSRDRMNGSAGFFIQAAAQELMEGDILSDRSLE